MRQKRNLLSTLVGSRKPLSCSEEVNNWSSRSRGKELLPSCWRQIFCVQYAKERALGLSCSRFTYHISLMEALSCFLINRWSLGWMVFTEDPQRCRVLFDRVNDSWYNSKLVFWFFCSFNNHDLWENNSSTNSRQLETNIPCCFDVIIP